MTSPLICSACVPNCGEFMCIRVYAHTVHDHDKRLHTFPSANITISYHFGRHILCLASMRVDEAGAFSGHIAEETNLYSKRAYMSVLATIYVVCREYSVCPLGRTKWKLRRSKNVYECWNGSCSRQRIRNWMFIKLSFAVKKKKDGRNFKCVTQFYLCSLGLAVLVRIKNMDWFTINI